MTSAGVLHASPSAKPKPASAMAYSVFSCFSTGPETEYTPLGRPSHWMYLLDGVPDRLLTKKSYSFGNRPFLPLWLEVKSAPDTAPGVYRGRISLTGNDGKTLALPLEVKVWNFSLPERNIVPSVVSIWERDIQTYLKPGDTEKFVEILTAFADMLLDHRLNPTVLHQGDLVAKWLQDSVYPSYRLKADGTPEINWKYFDRIVDHLRTRGLSRVVIGPYYRSMEIWKNTQNPHVIWRAVAEHAAEKGYLKDALAYPIDEWDVKYLSTVNEVGSMLRKSAPGLTWLVTGGGRNLPAQGIENVGLWIPQFHWVNYPAMKKAQRNGTPVWSYVCSGPQYPVPNLHADTPAAGIRMVPVANLRFGFDGILHWAANFNTGKNAKNVNAYGAGEGRYIYADENGFPIPTVRLKVFGDGMEDWTVMRMLRERSRSAYESMQAKLEKLIPGTTFDPEMRITPFTPREATYHTFMDTNAFYGVYDEPEKYLEWRGELYRCMAETP